MSYMDDGGVIPAGIESREYEGERGHSQQFGIFKGRVCRKILPDDDSNSMKDRIEYVVRINGQDYPKAIDIRSHGGVFGYHETVRAQTTTELEGGELSAKTYDEKTDGEMVWVMFIGGNADFPIIIGSGEHPANKQYRKLNMKDPLTLDPLAPYDITEFNGVEFFIDKDGNYSIEQVGQKDIASEATERVILNPAGVGSKLTFFGNGDYKILTTDGRPDPEGDPDPDQEVSMTFTKADKKVVTLVQKNKLTMDALGIKATDKFDNDITMKTDGITVTDKSANTIVMEAAGITITDVNGHSITMSASGIVINSAGTCDVTASGLTKITAPNIEINGGISGITTANSHQGVVDLITGVPVQPSTTVKSDV